MSLFLGMIAMAFVLRHEIRRAPDRTRELPRNEARLRAEERRQRPEEGRN
ncbi:MAG: hypothetical protein JSR48_00320 [Verrucomicrobia bacterium]|nr:hypothetical protein [Verrucomicrobiota bacterium]